MNFFFIIFALIINNISFANVNNCTNIIENNLNAIVTYQNANTAIVNNTIPDSQTVILNCRKGYFLNNNIQDTSISLSCVNGELKVNNQNNSIIPACKTISCSVPSMSSVMANVKETPLQPLQLGEKFTYECKGEHAIFKDGKYYTSIEATCGLSGKLTPTSKYKDTLIFTNFQDCEKVCDISSVVFNNNIDISKSSLITQNQVKQITDVFLPLDSVLNLKCKDGYEIQAIEQGETVIKTEYQYNCKDTKKKIYECRPKRAKPLANTPPVSDVKQNTQIQTSCFVSSIIKMNSVIIGQKKSSSSINNTNTGGSNTVKDAFSNNDKIKMQCQDGYAFLDQSGVFKTEFDITCNGDNGSWKDMKACIKVCDLSKLKEATTNVGSIELLKNASVTNIDTNTNKYISAGDRVRVNCIQGATELDSYEITNTAQTYYETTCLDGTNFSVGSSVPKCNKKVPKCINNDVKVVGELENKETLKESTNAGGLAPFICKGDGTNQQGSYFMAGGNTEGFNGVPICKYDPTTGKSTWSHANFKCFSGCIVDDVNVALGKSVVKPYKEKDEKNNDKQTVKELNLHTNNSQEVYISPGGLVDGKVKPGIMAFDEYHNSVKGGSFQKFIFAYNAGQTGELDQLNTKIVKYIEGIKEYKSQGRDLRRFGYEVDISYKIYSCTKQAEPQKFTYKYKLLKLSAMRYHEKTCNSKNKEYLRVVLVPINYGYDGDMKEDCTEKMQTKNLCIDHLKKFYNNDDHTKERTLSFTFWKNIWEDLFTKTPDEITDWNKCLGFAWMHVGSCGNYYPIPINIDHHQLFDSNNNLIDMKFRNDNQKYKDENRDNWQSYLPDCQKTLDYYPKQ